MAVTEESVGLSWEIPADNGGSDITGYVVEKRESNKRSYNKVSTTEELEYTVTQLTDKAQYVFRVAAQNDVGLSEFVELSQAVTAKSQHGMYKYKRFCWICKKAFDFNAYFRIWFNLLTYLYKESQKQF